MEAEKPKTSRQIKITYTMKKVKLSGKLSLNKETIAKLNNEQMANVIGGGTATNCIGCASVTCQASNCTLCFTTSGPPLTCCL